MKTLIYRVVGFGIILLIFTGSLMAQTVTIHIDSVRQTIRGFGGIHINSWQGTQLNEDLREKAFGNDPGNIGLTILRLRIDPDSNNFYRELPIAQHAVGKGALVFASPWNPPAYMLDPGSELNRLHEDYYDDYAMHLNQYYHFMNDSGVTLHAISIQNEPDYAETWTGWTSSEMITFLSENAQDIIPNVIAPESFQFRRSFTDPILNDAGAVANLDIVGGHIYGGGLFDYPLARERGKEVWMTEHLLGSASPADNTWDLALFFGGEINDCMQANFNAYVYWYIRRFYGLITDDGNITDKGYVISQYTKFIRPGAVRVDAEVESAPEIDVTAYKTDSSLVLVVVNHNSDAVTLDFTTAGSSIDSLVQFTTSATKKMVNDGGIAVIANSFTATVDARSVTTFTSYANNAAKPNNIAPHADAGDDIEVEDSDGDGIEAITLDATASNDVDGSIVNFSWSLNGLQIAWDSIHIAELPIGGHQAVLTVTDNDGATDSDTLLININSIYSTELWAEAECVQVGATWDTLFDEGASNGVYVGTPAGTERVDAPSTDPADLLVFNFHIDEAGPYKVWGRVITPSPTDDSFWVRIDEGTWYMWNGIPSNSNWHWDDVHDGGQDNPVIWVLDTGYHELSVCYREDGAYLDKLNVVNTGSIPNELGGEGLTCEITEPGPGPESIVRKNIHPEIMIYPNPASSEVSVSWKQGFSLLTIVNTEGQLVYQQVYQADITETTIGLRLYKGLYFIMLQNNTSRSIQKLMIE